MRKTLIWMIALIVLISSVNAIQNIQVVADNSGIIIEYPKDQYYQQNAAISLRFRAYNSSNYMLDNTTTTCTLYTCLSDCNSVYKAEMDFNTAQGDFYKNLNSSFTDTLKSKPYLVHCVSDTEAGFLSASYQVTKDGFPPETPSGFLTALILLPAILGILFIIGSALLGEDHNIFKMFLFILSPFPFIASFHFGLLAIIKFYNFGVMEELIGSTVYWLSWLLFGMISYWFIYIFIKLVHASAQKKKERLKY